MPIRPLWWYSTCIVVKPYSVSVWVAGEEQLLRRRAPVLVLDGSLVLGQEQDDLDSGFISNQAFVGHVTGLTIWSYALTSHQLQVWADCGVMGGPEAYLRWANIKWTIHNDTGDVKSHFDGPCHENKPAEAELMLFTNKMSWSEARQFLMRVGLSMINSYNTQEMQHVTDLLQKYKNECTNIYSEGVHVWLDISVNEDNITFRNKSQINMSHLLERPRKEKAHIWKYAVTLDEKGNLDKKEPSEPLCFVGRYAKMPEELRLRGLCGSDLPRNPSFIISPTRLEDQGNSVYLHGYGDYSIMQNASSSFWCLVNHVARGKVDKRILACTRSKDRGPPFGRLTWKLVDGTCSKTHSTPVMLVLSRCVSDHFTCPDSSCIHLSKLCDNVLDCKDGTDEKNCFTCIKPPGYMPAIPPQVPVQLSVKVAITQIGSTNLLTSAFSMDGTMTVSWTDHRLEFRHLDNNTGTSFTAVIMENNSKVSYTTYYLQ